MSHPSNPEISVEDFIAIQNLIGDYQWCVDGGDAEGWADLFLEDGAFLGGVTEPVVGRAALRTIPTWVLETWGGNLRHTTGSLHMRYGETTDAVIARYYSLVTNWNEDPPQLFTMSLSEMRLVRRPSGWRIQSNTVRNLARTRTIGDTD
jgi:ketosteroid isomerase-like protein